MRTLSLIGGRFKSLSEKLLKSQYLLLALGSSRFAPHPSLNTVATWGAGKVLVEREFGGSMVIDLLNLPERWLLFREGMVVKNRSDDHVFVQSEDRF